MKLFQAYGGRGVTILGGLGGLRTELVKRARHLLNTYLDKWNLVEKRTLNPHIVLAKEWEAVRSLWRVHYHKSAVWSSKIANTSSNATAPPTPNVEEPGDIDEFVDVLLANFEAASADNLQALTNNRHDPKVSLHMLGTRLNNIAFALEEDNLMTLRSLALARLQHLPKMIRKHAETQMKVQDK